MPTEITVDKEVSVDIEVDLERVDPKLLMQALNAQKSGGDGRPPVDRIWEEVMRHGRSLEGVVDDLMRENGCTWRRRA